MTAFLSPGERRLLAALDEHELPPEVRELPFYSTEGDVVRLFMDTFDAHMTGIPEPRRALREGEDQTTLDEEARRYGFRDWGRQAFGWD